MLSIQRLHFFELLVNEVSLCFKNHRIIECSVLEGTFKDQVILIPLHCPQVPHPRVF